MALVSMKLALVISKYYRTRSPKYGDYNICEFNALVAAKLQLPPDSKPRSFDLLVDQWMVILCPEVGVDGNGYSCKAAHNRV